VKNIKYTIKKDKEVAISIEIKTNLYLIEKNI